MSLRFSRVTLSSNGTGTTFLVGGIPKHPADLSGWTAFENFKRNVEKSKAITANVETFLYGEEEPFDATPEEVAYFYKRIQMHQDFIETRAEKIGESKFVIVNAGVNGS